LGNGMDPPVRRVLC